MKRSTIICLAVGLGAIGAVAVLGQKRTAAASTRVMKVRQLPKGIKELTSSSYQPPQSRVMVRFYDLNHDGRDEWIVSDMDIYVSGRLEYVAEKGRRATTVYQYDAKQGWQPILHGLQNENLKFIPTDKAGEHDDVEYTDDYNTTEAGYKGRSRDFILSVRWIDGKYQLCQCRDAQSKELVPCNSLLGQGNRTLTEEGFTINEHCP